MPRGFTVVFWYRCKKCKHIFFFKLTIIVIAYLPVGSSVFLLGHCRFEIISSLSDQEPRNYYSFMDFFFFHSLSCILFLPPRKEKKHFGGRWPDQSKMLWITPSKWTFFDSGEAQSMREKRKSRKFWIFPFFEHIYVFLRRRQTSVGPNWG